GARAYYPQCVAEVQDRLSPESAALPMGLPITAHGAFVQRYGGTADLDFLLPKRVRILGGVEAFNESVANTSITIQLPQGSGYSGSVCAVAADGQQLPGCPQTITHDVNRVVVASYPAGQWRPFTPLTLDAGLRLQQGFGGRPYALTLLYSAGAVWNFYRGYHLKFNYATGFRPPSFNNTDSTGAGLN